jgi:hypothetical protein
MVPGLSERDLRAADLRRHELLAAAARDRLAAPRRPTARRPVLSTTRHQMSAMAWAVRDLLDRRRDAPAGA